MQPVSDPKFCHQCGGPMEKRVPQGDHRPRSVCSRCGFIHYQQPKVAAGTLVELDGGLVLIKRGVEPRIGYWSFPCGFQEIDETVEQAARRETEEETGLRVELQGHHGTYSYLETLRGGVAVVIVVYRARVLGGELRATDDATEAKIVDPDRVAWDELAFRSTHTALKDWLALRANHKSQIPDLRSEGR